jgi:hypothetical protein
MQLSVAHCGTACAARRRAAATGAIASMSSYLTQGARHSGGIRSRPCHTGGRGHATLEPEGHAELDRDPSPLSSLVSLPSLVAEPPDESGPPLAPGVAAARLREAAEAKLGRTMSGASAR